MFCLSAISKTFVPCLLRTVATSRFVTASAVVPPPFRLVLCRDGGRAIRLRCLVLHFDSFRFLNVQAQKVGDVLVKAPVQCLCTTSRLLLKRLRQSDAERDVFFVSHDAEKINTRRVPCQYHFDTNNTRCPFGIRLVSLPTLCQ